MKTESQIEISKIKRELAEQARKQRALEQKIDRFKREVTARINKNSRTEPQ